MTSVLKQITHQVILILQILFNKAFSVILISCNMKEKISNKRYSLSITFVVLYDRCTKLKFN